MFAPKLFGPKLFSINGGNIGGLGPFKHGGFGGLSLGKIGPIKYGNLGGISVDSFLLSPNPESEQLVSSPNLHDASQWQHLESIDKQMVGAPNPHETNGWIKHEHNNQNQFVAEPYIPTNNQWTMVAAPNPIELNHWAQLEQSNQYEIIGGPNPQEINAWTELEHHKQNQFVDEPKSHDHALVGTANPFESTQFPTFDQNKQYQDVVSQQHYGMEQQQNHFDTMQQYLTEEHDQSMVGLTDPMYYNVEMPQPVQLAQIVSFI